MKIKNNSHRYDINKPRPRHRLRCTNNIKSVSV